METGKVEYAPDYTSKKLSLGWVEGDYGDFLDLSTEERAIVEARVERCRLEREVIEVARAERIAALAYEKHLVLENWKRQVDSRAAREASVDALIDFESKQERK